MPRWFLRWRMVQYCVIDSRSSGGCSWQGVQLWMCVKTVAKVLMDVGSVCLFLSYGMSWSLEIAKAL